MKKIVIVAIMLLAAAAMVTVAAYLIFKKRQRPAPEIQKNEAFYLTGKVLLNRKDSDEWQEAERDMAFKDGDTISTAKDSCVEIKLGRDEKNFIGCKDDTTVKFSKIEEAGDKKIELEKGKVMLLVDALDEDSKFEVRTSAAVCGVLGTGFEAVSSEDITTIKVYDGRVYAKTIGIMGIVSTEEVIVEEGTMIRIIRSSPPVKPVPLSKEDLEVWRSWKGDLDAHMFRTFSVYLDEGSPENHYSPSGWVGDYDAIRRMSWGKDPHSGKTCLRFRYTGRMSQGAGWVGVYWQNPVNNWGDVKGGYNMKGARKLVFWARGKNGGETIVRFGMGGIGGIYPDSAKAEIGPVVLEKEWKQYAIDLSGKDLSYISSGFYWMTDKTTNPDGVIFYLDDIQYE
ncbi:MAG: FecR domain-containing protein [Candidatus Omnitrophica bacterium]|nr:FecR domain-containing protein [Candidatus Omnitrophota bacterium]